MRVTAKNVITTCLTAGFVDVDVLYTAMFVALLNNVLAQISKHTLHMYAFNNNALAQISIQTYVCIYQQRPNTD